jgi:hypothetical protein
LHKHPWVGGIYYLCFIYKEKEFWRCEATDQTMKLVNNSGGDLEGKRLGSKETLKIFGS